MMNPPTRILTPNEYVDLSFYDEISILLNKSTFKNQHYLFHYGFGSLLD
jgi:hypothetical protein